MLTNDLCLAALELDTMQMRTQNKMLSLPLNKSSAVCCLVQVYDPLSQGIILYLYTQNDQIEKNIYTEL